MSIVGVRKLLFLLYNLWIPPPGTFDESRYFILFGCFYLVRNKSYGNFYSLWCTTLSSELVLLEKFHFLQENIFSDHLDWNVSWDNYRCLMPCGIKRSLLQQFFLTHFLTPKTLKTSTKQRYRRRHSISNILYLIVLPMTPNNKIHTLLWGTILRLKSHNTWWCF